MLCSVYEQYIDYAYKLVLDFMRRLAGAKNATIDALLHNFIKVGAIVYKAGDS